MRSQGIVHFFREPIHWVHRAIIFATARLSCTHFLCHVYFLYDITLNITLYFILADGVKWSGLLREVHNRPDSLREHAPSLLLGIRL